MKCNFHSPLVVLAEGAASGESPSQGITGFCEFNLRTLSSKESIASSTYSDYCGNSKMPVCKIPVEGFSGRATVSGKSIWALAECFWRGAWLGSIRIPAHKCLGALGRTLSQNLCLHSRVSRPTSEHRRSTLKWPGSYTLTPPIKNPETLPLCPQSRQCIRIIDLLSVRPMECSHIKLNTQTKNSLGFGLSPANGPPDSVSLPSTIAAWVQYEKSRKMSLILTETVTSTILRKRLARSALNPINP